MMQYITIAESTRAIARARLSGKAIRSCFLVGSLSEMLLPFWYDYANEMRKIYQELDFDRDILPEGQREHLNRKLRKLAKEEFEAERVNFFKVLDKFEKSITDIYDQIGKKVSVQNKDLMYDVQKAIENHFLAKGDKQKIQDDNYQKN